MMRNLITAVIVLVSVSLAVGQTSRPQPPKQEPPKQPKSDEARSGGEKQVVKFETSDGVKIAADYYTPAVKPGEKAPVAILIHMYPADRTSWEPLVPKLSDAGFAVLAYDIRGNGGSTEPADKNLQKMYKDQDPSLFKEAWKDTEAAKKWLSSKPECDVNKIAMIGASIGCSISLDYGSRDPAVKAIVCLSPGTDYFGVDSIAHIKKCGKRAILLLSPKTEHEAVKKLIKASGDVAQGVEYPGARAQHGTGMLIAPYGSEVKKRIVEFVSQGVGLKEAKSGEGGKQPDKKHKT
ncbi:MAG TPA: alpha/beta fold hydrolase [Phycisphaerae bacterium]|nr:alpha/beta fold hydrolase [Phycisphaerae bacterium]